MHQYLSCPTVEYRIYACIWSSVTTTICLIAYELIFLCCKTNSAFLKIKPDVFRKYISQYFIKVYMVLLGTNVGFSYSIVFN